MNENVNENTPQGDPLAERVDDVKTGFPLLPVGIYDLLIVKAEVGKKRDDPNKEVLTATFNTINDTVDTTGAPVYKGFPIYHRVALTPTEPTPAGNGQPAKRGYSYEDIKKKVAVLAQHAGVVGVTVRQVLDQPSILEGRTVRVKLGISKETEKYDEANVVKSFVDVV